MVHCISLTEITILWLKIYFESTRNNLPKAAEYFLHWPQKSMIATRTRSLNAARLKKNKTKDFCKQSIVQEVHAKAL